MPSPLPEALSPLDGRYAGKLGDVRRIFSESGLMRERVRVECAWLLSLADGPAAEALANLPAAARDWAARLAANPAEADVAAIKQIETRTNHDVKAVEYWVRAQLEARGAEPRHLEWVHFGCTSEDINNLAYALMLKSARQEVLLPGLDRLTGRLDALRVAHAAVGMLARTHGQSATPTTVGKEIANFAARLDSQGRGLAAVIVLGKMNGAVGNFNAHAVAMPQVDWQAHCERFVAALGLTCNRFTTQIEPHDWIAEYCHALMRINTVLLDFARDMWSYISMGYFLQAVAAGEVGSSTMPHKVNPIDFENAEGNLGLSNALLGFFAEKLPVSRLQRDLTDSTVLRNIGVAIGHCLLAFRSLETGLNKIRLDADRVAADLNEAWEVLAEAVQTVMRAQGIPDAYDRLKAFTRGRPIDRERMREFIASLGLPAAERERLLALTPADYVGFARDLALRPRSH